MKKPLALLGVSAVVGFGALALISGPAQATANAEAPTGPSFATCPNLTNWFVNPDETNRLPEATEGGLKFSGDDLIHHNITGLTTDDLEHGTFALAANSAAPDQDSFFSVEVANATAPSGYATLRWNTTTNKWDMVVGGQLYSNADPSELVEMVTPNKSKNVVRFGVGYTKNPPGTVATTVSSVTFQGTTYSLTCAPTPTTSPSASTSASPTASPSVTASPSPTKTTTTAPTHTVSTSPAAGLPVTGDKGPSKFVVIGAAALVLGAAGIVVARKRRDTKFVAE